MLPARGSPGDTLSFKGWLDIFYVIPANPAQNQVSSFGFQVSSFPLLRIELALIMTTGAKLETRNSKLETSLNHNLLLLRIYTTRRGLRRYRNHSFTRGQGRREVMELPRCGHHRDFAAIDHHAGSSLRLARNLDHVPMLDEWV